MNTVLTHKELSQTENDLVAEALANPVLLRYFQTLAHNIAVDIALCPIQFEEDPQVYIRKQHMLKGQLTLLDTLASAHQLASSHLNQYTNQD